MSHDLSAGSVSERAKEGHKIDSAKWTAPIRFEDYYGVCISLLYGVPLAHTGKLWALVSGRVPVAAYTRIKIYLLDFLLGDPILRTPWLI